MARFMTFPFSLSCCLSLSTISGVPSLDGVLSKPRGILSDACSISKRISIQQRKSQKKRRSERKNARNENKKQYRIRHVDVWKTAQRVSYGPTTTNLHFPFQCIIVTS